MAQSTSDGDGGRAPKAPVIRPGGPDDPPSEPDAKTLEPAIEYLRPYLREPREATQIVSRMVTGWHLFQGPLPPPDHFQDYERVIPGSAREILDMAKGEQAHRHKMQFLEMLYPYLGWFAGFTGFLACIACATYLAMNGQQVVAGAMLGLPSLGVIGWFIRSRLTETASAAAAAPARNGTSRVAKRRR